MKDGMKKDYEDKGKEEGWKKGDDGEKTKGKKKAGKTNQER